MRIRVLGCHAIGAEPWRLLEVEVSGRDESLDLSTWALPVPGEPRENWQAPHDEHVLTSKGWMSSRLDGDFQVPANGLRLCFWLYMIAEGPLRTPWGDAPIPPATARPEHLASLEFEQP